MSGSGSFAGVEVRSRHFCFAAESRHSLGATDQVPASASRERSELTASHTTQCLIAPGSLARISQKREYFQRGLETIGDFALRLCKLGAWRQKANLQKAATGGHFSNLSSNNLRLSDCLAGDAVLIAPVSSQIPS